MKELGVLIVGCGNIAGGFDIGRPTDQPAYTHAGAFTRDSRFRLNACIEPDVARRKNFMRTWDVPRGYARIEEALDVERPDVVSICSPTDAHVDDVNVAIKMEPKLIFCEKPLSPSVETAMVIVKNCRDAGIRLCVNHSRRWDADVAALARDIKSGRRGRLRTVLGIYNKGALNNGTHMLDLLDWLVGPLEIESTGAPVFDDSQADPTVPVWLKGKGGLSIHLAAAHAADYALFELQLVFEQCVIAMEDGGMWWRERHVGESSLFRGYRALGEGLRREGAYPFAMQKAVDNIYRAIVDEDPLESTGDSALLAQKTCDEIIRRSRATTA